ncbi:MAG: hypothetical protein HYR85_16805 [Planctomycetes bacterium]|nr:hypothetical protein [Planctomycetota bacterium]MBI3843793.1 hypothetical protein [Planctomycetota bacterium]
MIRRAYGRLIEICESEWLAEVLPGYSRSNLTPARLRHFAIYFDDGPLYEVLCAEADVTEAC